MHESSLILLVKLQAQAHLILKIVFGCHPDYTQVGDDVFACSSGHQLCRPLSRKIFRLDSQDTKQTHLRRVTGRGSCQAFGHKVATKQPLGDEMRVTRAEFEPNIARILFLLIFSRIAGFATWVGPISSAPVRSPASLSHNAADRKSRRTLRLAEREE